MSGGISNLRAAGWPGLRLCVTQQEVLPLIPTLGFAAQLYGLSWENAFGLDQSGRMAMPLPIAIPVRQAIFERRRRGESVGVIAHALGLKTRTVRHLVRRFAQRGPDGLAKESKVA